jgi:thiamine monophosphate kinase
MVMTVTADRRSGGGWTLARAHARSGDRIAVAGYIGGSAKFDQAIADFAETYADQNERDYTAFQAAVKEGKVEAATEI